MGIVNVTPDSFSDGGTHETTAAALHHCESLLEQGAHVLDIGGESTRPGAPPVPLDVELARVLPVVREAVRLNVAISVDTYKARVMQAVLDAGADIVNDIWALRQPGAMATVLAHASCGVCLMHMHGEPQSMQLSPMPQGGPDTTAQVLAFLRERTAALRVGQMAPERIVWDAGTGFGKTVAQNFELLARQRELLVDGHPLMAGWSRKSSLGAVTGLAARQRMVPSVAAALLAVERGARIVRVHDVRETVQALQVWLAMNEQEDKR